MVAAAAERTVELDNNGDDKIEATPFRSSM